MVQSKGNFGKRDKTIQRWICLDLDGTLLLKHPNEGSLKSRCHPKLIQTLHSLNTLGWNIAIITGRTFSFAYPPLSSFNFPYYLAVQQGSHLFKMPQEELLFHHLLEPPLVHAILESLLQMQIPTIAYLGPQKGDACLYSQENVPPTLLAIYEKIEKLSKEPWIKLNSLTDAKTFHSSLIKGFGSDAKLLALAQAQIEKHFPVATTLIKDPLFIGNNYLLITAKKATKGNIVKELLSTTSSPIISIGAGDDDNDLSMLQACTYRLVMDDAPEALLKIATSIVSSTDPLDLPAKIEQIAASL